MVHQWYNGVDNDNKVITRFSSFKTHMAYVCVYVCVYVCFQIIKLFLLIDVLIMKFIVKTSSVKNNKQYEHKDAYLKYLYHKE